MENAISAASAQPRGRECLPIVGRATVATDRSMLATPATMISAVSMSPARAGADESIEPARLELLAAVNQCPCMCRPRLSLSHSSRPVVTPFGRCLFSACAVQSGGMTSSGRRARSHPVAKALAPAALFALGVLTSIAVAGCGGGEGAGQVAGKVSTATREATPSRPAATQTVTQPPTTVARPSRSTVTTSTTVVVSTAPAPVTTTVLAPTTTAGSVTAVIVAPTTTNGEGSGTDTPAWVWIVVGLGAGGLIGLVVWLIRRNRGPRPPVEPGDAWPQEGS
jgi:hypothetical protein